MMYAKDTVYDYNWNYLSNSWTGTLGGVTSVVYVNGLFFLCRSMDVWRFSTTWTNGVIGTSIPSNPNYFSIAYDLTSNNFYVTSLANNRIDIYDYNLNYKSYISVSGGVGKGLAFFNGSMYVPNQNSQINILRNGTITNTVNITECSGTLGQITFDSNGYYAIACNSNSKVVLYNSANTFVSSLITDSQPFMSFIDNQGRYIVATYGAIDIFFSNITTVPTSPTTITTTTTTPTKSTTTTASTTTTTSTTTTKTSTTTATTVYFVKGLILIFILIIFAYYHCFQVNKR